MKTFKARCLKNTRNPFGWNQSLVSTLERWPASLVSGPSRRETGVQLLVWESFRGLALVLVSLWCDGASMLGSLPLSLGLR